MNSFALCPLQSGYNPKLGNGLLEQALLGGFARQRVQFVNNAHEASVSVMLESKVKQQYFYIFWRKHTQANPQPFLWRLMFNDFEMTDYICQFVADSLEIGERDGLVYKVTFRVRAKPNHTDQRFDDELITLWEFGNPEKYLDYLGKLVNQDLPKAMQGVESIRTSIDYSESDLTRTVDTMDFVSMSGGNQKASGDAFSGLTNQDLPKAMDGL